MHLVINMTDSFPTDMHQIHNISPVWDTHAKILILGSFPSVKSRESCFFYGHPQNRFWKVLASLLCVPIPVSIEEKRQLLLDYHIAVWDVIASCDITGSADSSIKNVIPNNLSPILEQSAISAIFVNGTTAFRMYEKYLLPQTGIQAIKLPSTSPANAAWNLTKLCSSWEIILSYLQE